MAHGDVLCSLSAWSEAVRLSVPHRVVRDALEAPDARACKRHFVVARTGATLIIPFLSRSRPKAGSGCCVNQGSSEIDQSKDLLSSAVARPRFE